MVMPVGGIATTNVDAATDDPSAARVEILAAITQLNLLITNHGIADGYASLDGSGDVPVAQLPAATTTASGVSERATVTEATTGTNTDRHVTPEGLAGRMPLKMSRVEIGTWNMDSTASVTVTHGLTLSDIISWMVTIRTDTDARRDILGDDFTQAAGTKVGGYATVGTTEFTLYRATTNGYFNSTAHDTMGDDGNRGFITIWHT